MPWLVILALAVLAGLWIKRAVKRIHIRGHERALLLKNGDFQRILEPGKHWVLGPDIRAEVYDISKPAFQSDYFEFIYKKHPALTEKYFTVVDLKDHQAALVYKDDKLSEIVPPAGRRAYWKGLVDVRAEVINIEENPELPRTLAENLLSLPKATDSVSFHRVHEHEVVLLYFNGTLVKQLPPGLNAFWKYNRTAEVKCFDLRLQVMEVSGQEILTKDKVSLRLNLTAGYKVSDAVRVTETLSDYKDFIYKELQFALRSVVGTRTLDELLEDKEVLNRGVLEAVRPKVAAYGLQLEEVGLKDIILPGDMRDILNQVVEAEKMAQANLIRRREETAATRSLLNTAKVMEDNPLLLRLKELEALEKITGRVDQLSIYNGFEGLLKDLVKLKDR